MPRFLVALVPLVVGCGGPARHDPVGNERAVEVAAIRPVPRATFTQVRSPEAFCEALAHRPRKPPAYADIEPVEEGFAPGELEEELGRPPGCITDRPAWSSIGNLYRPEAWTAVGPFAETRLLAIVDERAASGCALFVQRGGTWFVSLDAVAACIDDDRSYEEVTGSFTVRGQRLVIQASAGHDPCGCDEDLWVSHTAITVCGVAPGGVPACTEPIGIETTGVDTTMRPWSIEDSTLRLGAWIYGEPSAPRDELELVSAEDGGGPAAVYRLGF